MNMPAFSGAWGDFDNDHDLDLCLGYYGYCLLYRNDGGSDFPIITNTGDLAEASCLGGNMACADIDNDLDLDLAVSSDEGIKILRNLGGLDFQLVYEALTEPTDHVTSIAWADIDNDGDQDFAATQDNAFLYRRQTHLFLNDSTGSFQDVIESPPDTIMSPITDIYEAISTTEADKTSLAWCDADLDGDMDAYLCQERGSLSYPGGPGYNRLLMSYERLWGYDNHHLYVRCIGTMSNTAAIGARVYCYEPVVGPQMREINGGSGAGSQNSLQVEFGLRAPLTTIDSIVVHWPSGLIQKLDSGLQPNTVLTVVEPFVDSCEVLMNDSLFVCPAGDARSDQDSVLDVAIILRDDNDAPIPGIHPSSISVTLVGTPSYSDTAISFIFCPGPDTMTYYASDPTDENGTTVISTPYVGGCGTITIESVDVGRTQFTSPESCIVKSPDMNGDGTVNFLDTHIYLPDLYSGLGFCGDFNYSGNVNFFDTFLYMAHLSLGCHCP